MNIESGSGLSNNISNVSIEEILSEIVAQHVVTQKLKDADDHYKVDATILADYNVPLGTPLETAFEIEVEKRLIEERDRSNEVSGSIWSR